MYAFTKFIWIYPVKTLTSGETRDKLRIQQETLSSPEGIITHRKPALTSGDFQEYCKNKGIAHYTVTTGQPRSNGQESIKL